MRTRWRIQLPGWLDDEPPFGVFALVCLAWAAVGLVTLICAGIASQLITGSGQMNTFLSIWMAAACGVPLAALCAGCLIGGAILLVRHWPIRRVTESSPDLREVYRR